MQLWQRQVSVDQVLRDPDFDPEQREALAAIPTLRDYAQALGLEAGDQYRHFVPEPRDRILTNLVATRPGEVRAHGFRFPLVGRVPYKAFFERERAEREAARLRTQGFDVCVSGVPAYSTLGWFDDPVTAPMLAYGPGVLAEMVIHEWVHATFYVAGDAGFNEGVATFIGQEGAIDYFETRHGSEAAGRERARVDDEREIARTIAGARDRIKTLYQSAGGPERDAVRAQIHSETRAALAGTAFATRDSDRVAARVRLSDACLALASTYEADLARYRGRLDALGGDLSAFVERARAAAKSATPRATLLGEPEHARIER